MSAALKVKFKDPSYYVYIKPLSSEYGIDIVFDFKYRVFSLLIEEQLTSNYIKEVTTKFRRSAPYLKVLGSIPLGHLGRIPRGSHQTTAGSEISGNLTTLLSYMFFNYF
jgi:hypothetical protein